jgi:hypothetical protein
LKSSSRSNKRDVGARPRGSDPYHLQAIRGTTVIVDQVDKVFESLETTALETTSNGCESKTQVMLAKTLIIETSDFERN